MIADYSGSDAVNLDSASLFFGVVSPTFAPFSFSFSAFLYCSEWMLMPLYRWLSAIDGIFIFWEPIPVAITTCLEIAVR